MLENYLDIRPGWVVESDIFELNVTFYSVQFVTFF